MAHEVLSYRQHVTSPGVAPTPDVSRIVDVRGFNAARFDIVVLNTDDTLTILAQGSDDLENWTTLATLGTSFAVGFALPAAVTGITTSYLRLFLSIGGEGGGFAIVATGVNLTNL